MAEPTPSGGRVRPIVFLALALSAAALHADGWHSKLLEHKDPLDWWERERDPLGFPKTEKSTYADDPEAQAAEARELDEKIYRLLRAFLSTTDEAKRKAVRADLRRILRNFHSGMLSSGPMADRLSRRRVFIRELILGLMWLRSENINPKRREYPVFTKDLTKARKQIRRILVEIGEAAVPQLVERWVYEVRLGSSDRKDRSAAEMERRYGKGTLGLHGNDRLHRVPNLIDRIEEILSDIGAPTAAYLVPLLNHANHNLRRRARALLLRIGLRSTPALVEGMSRHGYKAQIRELLEALLAVGAKRFKKDSARGPSSDRNAEDDLRIRRSRRSRE